MNIQILKVPSKYLVTSSTLGTYHRLNVSDYDEGHEPRKL